jgi:2-dehydro-3-deoxyphosphogalactonate aldolase
VSGNDLFERYFQECPLIAIIRGVKPDEAEAIARALYEGGIRIIEVPLNSLDPLTSIRSIADVLGDRALIGAGTVVDLQDVERVKGAGGQLVVAPNTNPQIVSAAVAAGLASLPGFFTPSEAFTALACGATAIKLFPAEAASPTVLKAMRAVLPKEATIVVVGGVTPESIRGWTDAGAGGFGLGGGLYKPGQSPEETLAKARTYVAALGK